MDQQASEKANDIAEALIIAIEADADKASARRVVSALATRKNIIRLSLIESKSKLIVADSQHEHIGKKLNASYNELDLSRFNKLKKKNSVTAALTKGALYYQRTSVNLIDPSINRSRRYYIYLIYDEHSELVNFAKYLLTLIAIFFFGILALAAAVYFVQRRVLSLPLTAINDAIKSHDTKTKSTPIVHESNDELGRLVTSYNTLITELENHTESLELKSRDLLIAKEKAEEATKAKSEFLACMSHEIRTPINGVLGMLKLLENTNLNRIQQHKAKLIRSSSESLLAIVNDILDFSKIEAGKMELSAVDFDLPDLLSNFTELTAHKAKEKKVEVILDICRVAHTHVKGDPDRLRQILTNLIGNAIKFTEWGEIIISAATRQVSEEKIEVSLIISDTGIGIPDEKISILFDSFTQVDSSTTRQFGGTGLGLAITKNLCNLMGGDISVASQVEKGSSFELSIQLKPTNDKKKAEGNTVSIEKNILIADKNKSSNTAICNLLASWGSYTQSISDSEDFIESMIAKLEVKNYELLILDYDLFEDKTPDMIQTIRATPLAKNIKIILMAELQYVEKLVDIECLTLSSIFEKPATQNNLLSAIKEAECDEHIKNIQSSDTEKRAVAETTTDKKINILLVEDNDINQEVVLGLLEEIGQKADVANNGVEALQALKNTQEGNRSYDLILMDCQMPIMDGYETTIAIRGDPSFSKYHKIPIIALTANAMSGDREKCIASGMSDYLTKPIDPETLFKAIRFWGMKQTTATEINIVSQAASPTEDTEVWDKASVLRRIGNKEERLKKLVERFLASMPNLFDELELSIKEGDPKSIALQAHGIKGVTGNLSAMALMDLSKQLEFAAKNSNIEEVHALWGKFNDASRQLELKLTDYVNS